MSKRLDYVKYDEKAQEIQHAFKTAFAAVERLVDTRIPATREQEMAHARLEEAYMWVGKAIRNDQIVRNGSAPLQEERGDDAEHDKG